MLDSTFGGFKFAGFKFCRVELLLGWIVEIQVLLDSNLAGFDNKLDLSFAGFNFCWIQLFAGFNICWIQVLLDSTFGGFKFAGFKFCRVELLLGWIVEIQVLRDSNLAGFDNMLDLSFAGFNFLLDSKFAAFSICWIQVLLDSTFGGFKFAGFKFCRVELLLGWTVYLVL